MEESVGLVVVSEELRSLEEDVVVPLRAVLESISEFKVEAAEA